MKKKKQTRHSIEQMKFVTTQRGIREIPIQTIDIQMIIIFKKYLNTMQMSQQHQIHMDANQGRVKTEK